MASQQQILFYWKAWTVCLHLKYFTYFTSTVSTVSPQQCRSALPHQMPCWAKLMSNKDLPCKFCVCIAHIHVCTQRVTCVSNVHLCPYLHCVLVPHVWSHSVAQMVSMGRRKDFLPEGHMFVMLAKLTFPMFWWGLFCLGSTGRICQ